MIVNEENLKSVLKTKWNQWEMLNKSLKEMIEKDSNEETIKTLRSAIDDTYDEMEDIKEELKKYSKKDKESLYDSISKHSRKSKEISMYDSIKKDYGVYETPYNKLNYEEEYKKACGKKLPIDDGVKMIMSNMFLVRFGNALNIQEWLVKGVNISPFNKEIIVYVNNHLAKKKGKEYPILSEVFAQKSTFPISIDYLDPTGVVLYTERYHGCRIIEVDRSGLDYACDDINSFGIRMTYSEITYETAH